MAESRIITVQMTVGGSNYYMATEGFVGSNFYYPFVQKLPRIEWFGEGWLKTKAGQLTLTNEPDSDQHPFGYSTNWNSLITNPDQQFLTAIHPGEPEGEKVALWLGYAVLRTISENGLSFDLFSNAKATALDNQRLVGSYPVSSLTAGDPTVLAVDNREMGSNTASTWIKVGDYIQVNNTFSPVQANTDYLVTATSSNNISIDLDSTGTTFATPRVVTNTYDSGSGTRCIMSKLLTVPYVSFGNGATQHLIPRDRYYQDGYYGYYYFTPFQNWYPSSGIGSTFKIFVDGVDVSSSYTLSSKSYRRTDGAAFDGTITVETVTTYKTVFDLVDLLYSPTSATKAPNSDDAVKAGIIIEYSNDTDIEDFLDYVCKNTNYQFYVRYTSATDSALNGYLIDRANVPSATALDEFSITAATYQFRQPTKAVSCEFTSNNISGTLTGDNFQFVTSKKNISVTNTDLTSGSEIHVNQMHDSLGQQLAYLQSILDVQKKIYLTVTVDHINETILPGDNLSFSREIDKITVSSLLVRKIIYDMNRQTTQFCGDGTVSMFERS
tara:strand:+ start:929 stop:2584 length:1656 start_codon:yes stop_codon:yes gene_type:complete